MALKDWKKVGKYNFLREYPFFRKLIIEKYDNNWEVSIFKSFSFQGKPLLRKSFKTKSQALKFAKSYMKKH